MPDRMRPIIENLPLRAVTRSDRQAMAEAAGSWPTKQEPEYRQRQRASIKAVAKSFAEFEKREYTETDEDVG